MSDERVRRIILATLFLMALPTPRIGWAASPAGANVLVARDRTEPFVAVDPRRPSHLVIGTNTDYAAPVSGLLPTGVYVSRDGGHSFSGNVIPLIPPYTTGADPTAAVAQSGTVFYTYLAEAPAYCSGGPGAILLTTSRDGGASFRVPTVVDANSADDHPIMALESRPGRRATVIVSWTRWYARRSEIWYAISTNGGDSFRRAQFLYGSSLDNYGSVPLFGGPGQIFIFWSVFPDDALSVASKTRIFLARSLDGGLHFSAPRSITGEFRTLPRMAQPGYLRILEQPAVAATPGGILYLAWSRVSHVLGGGQASSDVVITRSRDSGSTWESPRTVNDSRRADRFMPALALLSDGTIGVVFYDRRDALSELSTYAARVSYRGGFHSSPNVRVNQSAAPFRDIFLIRPGTTCFSPGRFFGDYIGAAPGPADTLLVTWADSQSLIPNNTDIWFARVTLPARS
jgi:hypothetical protein